MGVHPSDATPIAPSPPVWDSEAPRALAKIDVSGRETPRARLHAAPSQSHQDLPITLNDYAHADARMPLRHLSTTSMAPAM